jgi:hypothetical protein
MESGKGIDDRDADERAASAWHSEHSARSHEYKLSDST